MVKRPFLRAKATEESAIRRLSIHDIQVLSQEAFEHERSARGRPAWLARNGDDVRTAVVRVFGRESEGVKRCIVTLVMESGPPRWFTVDVEDDALKELPVLDRQELADLVSLLIEHAVHVPVDE